MAREHTGTNRERSEYYGALQDIVDALFAQYGDMDPTIAEAIGATVHRLDVVVAAEAADLPFENYEILYKRQIKLGETVDLCYAFEEGRHVVEFRNQDGRRVHALLWFY